MLERVSTWIFRHRPPLVGLFVVVTVIMAVFASRLRVDASFNKSLPLDHPYIRTFTKYQSEFGGANRVLIALMAKDGDIFTPEFFAQLRKVTDETTFLPAVDRAQVQSLFTPNVRYIEVVEDGFAGGNVLPPTSRRRPPTLPGSVKTSSSPSSSASSSPTISPAPSSAPSSSRSTRRPAGKSTTAASPPASRPSASGLKKKAAAPSPSTSSASRRSSATSATAPAGC